MQQKQNLIPDTSRLIQGNRVAGTRKWRRKGSEAKGRACGLELNIYIWEKLKHNQDGFYCIYFYCVLFNVSLLVQMFCGFFFHLNIFKHIAQLLQGPLKPNFIQNFNDKIKKHAELTSYRIQDTNMISLNPYPNLGKGGYYLHSLGNWSTERLIYPWTKAKDKRQTQQLFWEHEAAPVPLQTD